MIGYRCEERWLRHGLAECEGFLVDLLVWWHANRLNRQMRDPFLAGWINASTAYMNARLPQPMMVVHRSKQDRPFSTSFLYALLVASFDNTLSALWAIEYEPHVLNRILPAPVNHASRKCQPHPQNIFYMPHDICPLDIITSPRQVTCPSHTNKSICLPSRLEVHQIISFKCVHATLITDATPLALVSMMLGKRAHLPALVEVENKIIEESTSNRRRP